MVGSTLEVGGMRDGQDDVEIIERVAALDVGKAEVVRSAVLRAGARSGAPPRAADPFSSTR